MNHDEIKEKLFALYDNEVTPQERVVITAHLKECGECRALLTSWESTAKTLFQSPTLSSRFEEKMQERLQKSPVVYGRSEKEIESVETDDIRSPGLFRWLVPALALASIGFLFVLLRPVQDTKTSAYTSFLMGTSQSDLSQWVSSPQDSNDQVSDYLLSGGSL